MLRAIGFWPVGQKQREVHLFSTSPFVANTARPAQNRQSYTKPCLFSRALLHSAGFSQDDPLASLTHSWQSVPACQPTRAEMSDSGHPARI